MSGATNSLVSEIIANKLPYNKDDNAMHTPVIIYLLYPLPLVQAQPEGRPKPHINAQLASHVRSCHMICLKYTMLACQLSYIPL